MVKETDIGKEIQVDLSPTTVLFRNNQGVAKHVAKDGKIYFVKYGVAPGGADYLGWSKVVITPEMVGKTVAIFTAIETKQDGKKGIKEQIDFINAVLENGGYAGIATDIQSARKIVHKK